MDGITERPDPLQLARLPFVFEQDGLLSTSDFLKEADARALPLKLDDLAELHKERLLVPLLRVKDEPDADLMSPAPIPDRVLGHNATGWALMAAVDGRLRDPWLDTSTGPYQSDSPPNEWWDGYVWSPWQLLDLHQMVISQVHVRDIAGEGAIGGTWARVSVPEGVVLGWRRRTVVLAALASRHLPSVLGRVTSVSGDFDRLLAAVEAVGDADCLRVVQADPAALRPAAEGLLSAARTFDPNRDWLPLLAHLAPGKWLKLRGAALDALWHRVAAEILLRSHEGIAAEGGIDPLPTLEGTGWWTPLHDRLRPQDADRHRLEPVLADFGLTPDPAVLLLVEGPSELEVVPDLLADLGIGEDLIRVQSLEGVGSQIRQLVKYQIAPRLGRLHDDSTLFLSPPTSLRILLDPEGRFSGGVAEEMRKLRDLVRAEIEHQGHSVTEEVLEKLVDGEVFPDCFEFANFTVDEIVDGALVVETANGGAKYVPDRSVARSQLEECRAERQNLKRVLGPWRVRKPDLARALLPVLQIRLETKSSSGSPTSPLLRFLWDLAETARRQPRRLTTM